MDILHRSSMLDECDALKIFQTCDSAFSCFDLDVIYAKCLKVMQRDCRQEEKPVHVGGFVTHFVRTHGASVHKLRFIIMKIQQLCGKLENRKTCVICNNVIFHHRDINIVVRPNWHLRTVVNTRNHRHDIETEEVLLNMLEYSFPSTDGCIGSRKLTSIKLRGAYSLCDKCLVAHEFTSIRSFCKRRGLVCGKVQKTIEKMRPLPKVVAKWQQDDFYPVKVLERFDQSSFKCVVKQLRSYGVKRLLV